PVRGWVAGLSVNARLIVGSAICGAIIGFSQWLQIGGVFAVVPLGRSARAFSTAFIYSAVLSVVVNLVIGISNIIGRRALLNFFTGRYHTPVEENRFVLFVDIAGSTGLAEQLGGVAIHRLLDLTFRRLSLGVVDYGGEVLNYVGDEVIVTWPERRGAVDHRPLRCFVAMREELSRERSRFEREFAAVPRIRGSLHFGPVIVGEIGDIKRAIVF